MVYLRIITDSGVILFDPKYKNVYFTLFCLSFILKIVPIFKNVTYPQNRSTIGSDTSRGKESVSKVKKRSGIILINAEIKNMYFTLF